MSPFMKYCKAQRAHEVRVLELIAQGVTFQESVGNAPMQDVTEERRAESIERIEQLDAIIADWEARYGDDA